MTEQETKEYYAKKRAELEERFKNMSACFLAMGLRPNTPQLEVLGETIKDGKYCIRIEAAGGIHGLKQIHTYNRAEGESSEDMGYCSFVYASLSELLSRAEVAILNGQTRTSDPGRCHRCLQPNYIGENDLETWLIAGISLHCYCIDGVFISEIRKCGQFEDCRKMFVTATGSTLGECLQNMNNTLAGYDLENLKDLFDFNASPSDEDIKKRLAGTKSR